MGLKARDRLYREANSRGLILYQSMKSVVRNFIERGRNLITLSLNEISLSL